MANPGNPDPNDPRLTDPLNPARQHGNGDPVIDNRTTVGSRGSGSGWLIAAIVVVLAIVAYFVFGRSAEAPSPGEPPAAGETAPAQPAPSDGGTMKPAEPAPAPATPPANNSTEPAPATPAPATPPADNSTAPANPPASNGTTQPAPAQ